MAFWSDSFNDTLGSSTVLTDPKRKFRFKVVLTNMATDYSMFWWAKTANKPSFTIAAAEHKYLNHTFYYPGSVTWNEVVVTMVDPGGKADMAATLSSLIVGGGYNPPAAPSTAGALSTMTKKSAVTALGDVTISQLNGEGAPVESWKLYNAFITDVKYGDLAYGDDELVEMSVTFRYDWATLTPGDNAASAASKGADDASGAATSYFNV